MRRDGAANRERILDAAEQVFGAQGSSGSTEEVARLAGVGVATVFRHFPTKADLITATAVRHLQVMLDRARSIDTVDPGDGLESVMRMLVATGPTKATLLHGLLDEGADLPSDASVMVEQIRATVGDLLQAARRAGTIRPGVTVDDVFVHARALAHIATPDNQETIHRALSTVVDGMTPR